MLARALGNVRCQVCSLYDRSPLRQPPTRHFSHFLRLLRATGHCFASTSPQRHAVASYGRQTASYHSVTAQPDKNIRYVAFISDVEGNLRYFLDSCSLNPLLDVHDGNDFKSKPTLQSKSLRLSQTRDDAAFVYGGDCFDKGPGDIRIARALVDLKQRRPNHTFLLLGNRDVGKLRLSSELAECDLQRHPSSIPPAFWIPPKAQVTLDAFLHRHNLPDSRFSRMNYLSRHALGCAGALEFRREELNIITGRLPTDAEVADSFYQQALEGVYRDYVIEGQIILRIKDTLFSHGAPQHASAGFIPHPSTRLRPNPVIRGHFETDLEAWISGLNDFATRGKEEWMSYPRFNHARSYRGGEALMAYFHRSAVSDRTVGVGDFTDASGTPCLPHANVMKYFQDNGVRRAMTGHKPIGDTPVILRGIGEPLQALTVDTSFSDTSSSDNRGKAIHSVVVCFDEDTDDSQVVVEGQTHSGHRYLFALPTSRGRHDVLPQARHLYQDVQVDSLVGFYIAINGEDWLVRAPLTDSDDTYWVSQTRGKFVHLFERLSGNGSPYRWPHGTCTMPADCLEVKAGSFLYVDAERN